MCGHEIQISETTSVTDHLNSPARAASYHAPEFTGSTLINSSVQIWCPPFGCNEMIENLEVQFLV